MMKINEVELTLIKTEESPQRLQFSFSSNLNNKNFLVSFSDVSSHSGKAIGSEWYFIIYRSDENGNRISVDSSGNDVGSYDANDCEEEPSQEYALKLIKQILRKYLKESWLYEKHLK